jgi:plasmid stability protein
MRTTFDLDDDLIKQLRDRAHKQRRSSKAVLDEVVRAGLGKTATPRRKKITFPTYNMGQPAVDMTKALALAAEMEDQEIIRKLQLGK